MYSSRPNDPGSASPPCRQRGLGLISAIFVITLMALLAVGLSKLVIGEQQVQAYELLSARALLAAESGAQLTATRVLHPASDGRCEKQRRPLPASAMRSCRVTSRCIESGPIDGQRFLRIESVGECGKGSELAVRSVTLRLTRPAAP